MLQLLTATGARPEAWALCERWMAAQTYAGPVVWVVVDDGPVAQPVRFERAGWTLDVIRPTPLWCEGQNTQARNLLTGLAAIDRRHPLLVIEDDDHYAADWLEHASEQLSHAELVGEVRARYYNLALRRGQQLSNTQHASLCASAMRDGAIDAFERACHGSPKFIDIVLWRAHPSRHLFGGHRVTGIKGLPGRSGIGMGHRGDFSGVHDAGGSLLSQWIGDDARFYRE
jgi:hypothetical protein